MDIKKLFDKIKTELSTTDAVNDKNVTGMFVGFESVDGYSAGVAKEHAADLESKIMAAFEAAKLEDEINIPTYAVEAAKKAALLAVDPVTAIKNLDKTRQLPSTAGYEADVIEATLLDDNDFGPGYEAFDGENVRPSVHFTAIYNTLAIKQDDVVELFFPVVPIDPKTAGATLTILVDSVIKEFNRTLDANPNKPKFDKRPLVKIINNPDEIDVDKNRLVPVLRDENKVHFVDTLAHVVNYNGETVTTAPIKFSDEINLLAASQTDSMLAKGMMDQLDALDANVRVTDVYASLSGKDSNGNDITEVFRFDVSNLPVHFTYSRRDHNKDIELLVDTEGLSLIAGQSKTANGATSQLLAQLPEGYTAVIRLRASGSGNTQTGDIVVDVNGMQLVRVLDAAGNEVPKTSDVYGQFADLFATLTPLGYEVEAYVTNSNARVNGLIVTTDKYMEVYTVPYRTGITVQLPVVNNGDDGDLTYLNTQINVTRAKMNMAGFKVLNKFIDYLRANPTIDPRLLGVSDKLVNKFFVEETVDLTKLVDSMNSNTRQADVRAALALKIKNAAIKAFLESNYGIALMTLMPDVKPTVIIGTDPIIGNFLMSGDELANDPQFNFEIRTSVNPLIRGKIIFSFGIFDGNRNKEANPLNFGQCFWSPELVINVVKTVNNSTRQELTTMPRFRHVVNLPIINVFNVTNVEAVLGKLPVYTQNV